MFGHSDSHVALQVADILASAVLFPAACSAYCQALTWNQHIHPGYGPDPCSVRSAPQGASVPLLRPEPAGLAWRDLSDRTYGWSRPDAPGAAGVTRAEAAVREANRRFVRTASQALGAGTAAPVEVWPSCGRKPTLTSAYVVGEGGLEPPQPFGHWHLKPARLPIPPLARAGRGTSVAEVPPARTRHGLLGTLLVGSMGLQRFEQRLERLVEGVFAKAFRSGLQPVELGRRLVREMDLHRTLGVRGTMVANRFTVAVGTADRERLAPIEQTLVAELVDTARQHARDQRYRFAGMVSVRIVTDAHLAAGSFRVTGEMVEGGPTGAVVLPDGTRIGIADEPITVGRGGDCDLVLADPTVSKHHLELRRQGVDVVLVDLGSTNGTRVNGAGMRERFLADGDEIRLGATVLRYEAV